MVFWDFSNRFQLDLMTFGDNWNTVTRYCSGTLPDFLRQLN